MCVHLVWYESKVISEESFWWITSGEGWQLWLGSPHTLFDLEDFCPHYILQKNVKMIHFVDHRFQKVKYSYADLIKVRVKFMNLYTVSTLSTPLDWRIISLMKENSSNH